jgi:hypothetical protein
MSATISSRPTVLIDRLSKKKKKKKVSFSNFSPKSVFTTNCHLPPASLRQPLVPSSGIRQSSPPASGFYFANSSFQNLPP